MADNRKYYYLKLKEDFFDSDELKILESQKDGYLYSNILLKLYLKSLSNAGRLMFRNVIPYTPEVLATLTGHQVGTVEKALDVFKRLGLIEVLDNGAIYMMDIQNFIGQSSSEADRQREYYNRMKAEKEASDMKTKAEADAKKLLDDAKKKEEELKNKIAELKTKQAERVVARKEAADQAKTEAEEKKKKDLSAIDKAEADVKKQLEDIRSKATAAAKVLEKAIKREEEYKKQEELLKEGKVEEAAQVITQDEEATMAASVSEAVAARRKSLPKEAKYLYKYLGVEPAGAQIVNVLQTLKVDPKRSKNVVILGQHGFGLTMVGEDFAKFYYDMGICKSEAKAKVKAKVINSGKLAGAVGKLKGGCLIIESAGLITPERFKEMVDMCSPEKNDVKIILTGEKTALSNMLAANMTQARSFNNRVYFDQINESGMINVAECYADEKGFKLESGADTAIKNALMAMESGNIDRLLGAMDDAMKAAETRDPIDKKILKKEIK